MPVIFSKGLPEEETSAQLTAFYITWLMPVQLLKAFVPIKVTPVPMVSVPEKPETRNALLPIEVTELGMVNDPEKLSQPAKVICNF